jgi:glycerophosphoryl diester phosphodiesterase
MLYLLLVGVGGGLGPQRNDHFAWSGDSLLLFAHRGVAVEVPENSEASLAAALEAGFQAVEIDVRKTRDGELALFHDRSALRMIGLDAEVGDLTLAQIKARKLRFKEVETPFTAPTLREVFQKFGGRLLFYLDMKNTGFKDADQIVGLIREFGLEERTILASVDPLFVAYVEQHYPAVNTALERFDPYQMVLYRLIPTRWKPDFLSGFARKVSPAHARWLREEQLLSNRIVYEAGGTNYDRVLGFGITKAIVDYDPQVHARALSRRAAPPSKSGR